MGTAGGGTPRRQCHCPHWHAFPNNTASPCLRLCVCASPCRLEPSSQHEGFLNRGISEAIHWPQCLHTSRVIGTLPATPPLWYTALALRLALAQAFALPHRHCHSHTPQELAQYCYSVHCHSMTLAGFLCQYRSTSRVR